MAAGDIVIRIDSETKAFKQGVETGIIDPLEDADKALTDLGKNKGPDQLEKSLKEAQRSTENLEKETKKVADHIEREYRDAYKSVGASAEDGLGKVKGASQEVTQEVGQNLGEAVSSVRGDLSDLGQVGQDTLGGLAATIAGTGPAGLVGAAALAAGAVGLGLVTAELQAQQEEAQKLKERMSGLYQAALESGRDYIDQSQFIAESNDLRFNPDRADEWKRLQAEAKTLGIDQNTIIKANSGDLASQEEIQRRINQLLVEGNTGYDEIVAGSSTLEQKLGPIEDRWKNINEQTREQKRAVEEAQAANTRFWQDAIRDAGTATEEVDEFGNKLYSLPSGQQVLIEADTGRATDDLEKFKGDLDKVIPTVKTTTIIFDVDDTAVRNYKPPKIYIPGTVIPLGQRQLLG